MPSVGSIVCRVQDLDRQVAFWSAALDDVPRDVPEPDRVVLRPRVGSGPNVSFDRKRSVYELPPRLHLDLFADDRGEEVARLIALGATSVLDGDPDAHADWPLLDDPERNRFDVIDARPRS